MGLSNVFNIFAWLAMPVFATTCVSRNFGWSTLLAMLLFFPMDSYILLLN